MAKKKKRAHRPEMSKGPMPRVLFVCVRDRHGKDGSCAGSGSRALVADARTLLERESIGTDELSIRPVGCLGLCERGPVCVAAAGKTALDHKPPKVKKGSRRGDKPVLVSLEVGPQDLRLILREALLQGN
jgi:hypothetical protein